MHPRYYRLLHYFVETVRAGSVTGAAEKLHVSAPVVSQALTDLEQRLAVSLLQRSARAFSLTEVGHQVYEDAQRMMKAANDALDAVEPAGGSVSGHISITLPTELAMGWLPERLVRFNQDYPDVDVTVRAEDQTVDLAQSDIELALRAKYVKPSLSEEPASEITIPLVLAAHKDCLDSYHRLIEQGKSLPFIGFSQRSQNNQVLVSQNGSLRTIKTQPQMTVNNGLLARQLCRHKVGAALLLSSTIEEFGVAGNELQPIFPECDYGQLQLDMVCRDVLPRRIVTLLAETLQT